VFVDKHWRDRDGFFMAFQIYHDPIKDIDVEARLAEHDGMIFKTQQKFTEGDYLIKNEDTFDVVSAADFKKRFGRTERVTW
jgi:hypothetical protein